MVEGSDDVLEPDDVGAKALPRGKPSDVAALPGCLDCAKVVAVANVCDGVHRVTGVESHDARQRRPCSPTPSAARDLNAIDV